MIRPVLIATLCAAALLAAACGYSTRSLVAENHRTKIGRASCRERV